MSSAGFLYMGVRAHSMANPGCRRSHSSKASRGVLFLPEMAFGRCQDQEREGIVLLVGQCPSCCCDRGFGIAHVQVGARQAGENEVDARVPWIDLKGAFKIRDPLSRRAGIAQGEAELRQSDEIAWIERDGAFAFGDRKGVVPGPQITEAEHAVGLRVAVIQRDRPLRRVDQRVDGCLPGRGISEPEVAMMGVGQPRHGLGVARVQVERLLEHVARAVVAVPGPLVEKRHAPLVEFPGLERVERCGTTRRCSVLPSCGSMIAARYCVISSWTSKMSSISRSNFSAQMWWPVAASISWALTRTRLPLAHAAFEHVAGVELGRDLADVRRLALVGEGRVAGDHRKLRQAESAVIRSSVRPSTK